MKLKLIIIVLAWGCLSLAWAAKPASEQLKNFLEHTQSYQAQFQQQVIDDKGYVVEQSRGMMLLQRPNQFRWEYKQPYVQVITANGEKIFIYDPDLEQLTIKIQETNLQATPALLLSGKAEVLNQFTLEDMDSNRVRLKAIPPKQGEFQQIIFGFEQGKLVYMEMMDSLSQRSVFRFSNGVTNIAFKSEAFVIHPPKGTDVIESLR